MINSNKFIPVCNSFLSTLKKQIRIISTNNELLMNAAEDTSHNCDNLRSNITKTCEKTGQSELNNINYGEEKITGKLNIDVRVEIMQESEAFLRIQREL